MMSGVEIGDLQRISDYRVVRKSLRTSGIGSIIWGIIAVVVGGLALRVNVLNIFLVTLGLLLIGTGVLNIVAPMPIGIIIDGIVISILGVWNIFISLANIALGAQGGGGGF